ncbi:MAG: hypothetical protein ACP5LP_02510 [Candidatus Micrarchaeia archaeon]
MGIKEVFKVFGSIYNKESEITTVSQLQNLETSETYKSMSNNEITLLLLLSKKQSGFNELVSDFAKSKGVNNLLSEKEVGNENYFRLVFNALAMLLERDAVGQINARYFITDKGEEILKNMQRQVSKTETYTSMGKVSETTQDRERIFNPVKEKQEC